MYRLGLCSISFRDLDCESIIKLVKQAGLSCIEWGSDVHAKKDDTAALKSIARLCAQYGIECSSYGTYFRLGVTPKEEIYDYIRAAKLLGTDTLRLWCGDKGSADYTASELESVINDCAYVARVAQEQGVTLCLECHIKTLTDSPDSTLEIMKRVASPSFKMYWQPNQFKSFDENMQYAKAISGITEHIHVFNWEQREKYPLALAKDVWQSYLSCFCQNRTLLLEFMPDGSPESLITEAAALKEIVGESK